MTGIRGKMMECGALLMTVSAVFAREPSIPQLFSTLVPLAVIVPVTSTGQEPGFRLKGVPICKSALFAEPV